MTTAVAYLNGVAHFSKGIRVRLSPEGLKMYYSGGRHGKKTDWPTRLGTVVAHNRGPCVSVRWDGNVTTESLHHSFLEYVS